jgi:zinc transport system substrate-binding protein
VRAVVLLLLTGLLTGCVSGFADDGRAHVLASAYPFAWAAEQVAGPDASVTDLVKSGAEPHDIELSPRQVAQFQDATVVVYLHGFQGAVDKAVDESPQAARLDLTAAVDPQGPDSGLTEKTSTGVDPHVWLDPIRMKSIVEAIAAKLASRDARHADGYRRRAAATDARLDLLDTSLRQGLAHCRRTDIVTSHTAFAYLARRYGLHQVGIAGLSPDAEPAPGRLAQVARFAQRNDVTTIFFESRVDPKLAQTVASEVGAKTAVLDPVEGVRSGDDYLSVMTRNVTALRLALDCG